MSSDKAFKIFFAIRFTGPKVDRIADDLKIKGDLDNGNIRYQFNRHMQKEFSAFDARQRFQCIQFYLESEIDFDNFEKTGIILEHYPLHRTSASEGMRESVSKYSGKLMKNLRTGNSNWLKYLEPIHLIKKYYGERFGFQFLYFINY